MRNNSNAKYILNVLLKDPIYMMSWGAINFKYKDNNSLTFDVNGFKYKGNVEVRYVEGRDTFDVILSDKHVEDVHVGELHNTIDRLVEKGDMTKEEYENKVENEYGDLIVLLCQR